MNVTITKNHLKHYEGEIYTKQSQRNVQWARMTKDQKTWNLVQLERIITFIPRIHPDYSWLQKRTQQELVFIRILVQRSLEQDLSITKVRTIDVYQDNYHSITESVNRIL